MLTSLVLFSLFAVSWAIVSTYMFRPHDSIFSHAPLYSFWGLQSWVSKYQNAGDRLEHRGWYYRMFDLYMKERFPLSATLLVFLTDALHFFQFLSICFATAALATFPRDSEMSTLSIFVIYHLVWSGTFTIVYNFILIRKK